MKQVAAIPNVTILDLTKAVCDASRGARLIGAQVMNFDDVYSSMSAARLFIADALKSDQLP